MKAAGICLILSGCAGIGIYYRIREGIRCRNLMELQRAVQILEGEIAAMHTPLPDAMRHVAARVHGAVSELFLAAAVGMENKRAQLGMIWQREMEKTISDMQLRREDRQELSGFGDTLGYLDVSMQLQCIALYKKRLDEGIGEMQREKNRKGRIYPVLGLATGIFLCVFIL